MFSMPCRTQSDMKWLVPHPPSPPLLQIFTIDQLLTYLRKFLVTEEAVVKAEEKAVEVPQGGRKKTGRAMGGYEGGGQARPALPPFLHMSFHP